MVLQLQQPNNMQRARETEQMCLNKIKLSSISYMYMYLFVHSQMWDWDLGVDWNVDWSLGVDWNVGLEPGS